MIHRISPYTIPLYATTAGNTVNVQFGQGRISHLLLQQNWPWGYAAPAANTDPCQSFLSVRLTCPLHEPIVLVPRMNCMYLQEISNYEAGFSQLLSDAIASAAYKLRTFAISLGNLDLSATGGQIDITYETGFASVTTAALGSICVVSQRPDEPDFIHQHSQIAAMTGTFEDTDRIYLGSTAAIVNAQTSFPDGALNIALNSPNYMPSVCDIKDVIAATAVFGEIEGYDPQWIFVPWAAEDELGHKVSLQISGTAAVITSIVPIIRSKIYKKDRLLANTEARLTRSAAEIAPRSQEKQIALAGAGISATHGQIQAAQKGHAAMKKAIHTSPAGTAR